MIALLKGWNFVLVQAKPQDLMLIVQPVPEPLEVNLHLLFESPARRADVIQAILALCPEDALCRKAESKDVILGLLSLIASWLTYRSPRDAVGKMTMSTKESVVLIRSTLP